MAPTYARLPPSQEAGTQATAPHDDNHKGRMSPYSDDLDAKPQSQKVLPYEPANYESSRHDATRRPTTSVGVAATNAEKGKIETDEVGRKPSPLLSMEDEQVGLHPPASFLSLVNNAVNEWWLWEIFGWLLSLLALAALIAVLAIYDQKPVPRWELGITLNAIISICAIVAQTTMLIPIAQGISQLKWRWFHRRHALSTMQLFDDASRGPWGAFLLLLSTKALLVYHHSTVFKLTVDGTIMLTTSSRHLPSLGALIAILALAIEPFIQQVVSYPLRRVRAGDASVASVQSYNITGQMTDWEGPIYDIDLPMKAAINQAIFSETNQMAFGCPTGNCTWPTFPSLAICSHCQNVKVHNDAVPGRPTVFYTSNGLNVSNAPVGDAVLSSGKLAVPDLGYTDNAISNFTVLDGIGEPSAYECALFWCVQEISASVTAGKYHEDVLTTWSNSSLQSLGCNADHVAFCHGAVSEGNEVFSLVGNLDSNSHSPTNFSLGIATQATFKQYLSSLFTGNVSTSEVAQDLSFSSDFMGALVPSRSSGATDIGVNLTNIPELMSNLSQSMTIRMRQSAVNNPEAQIAGDAYELDSFVEVRWAWLALPLALLLLTLIFLLASIRTSARAEVMPWKSSSIALLFHGLPDDRRALGSSVERRAEMNEIAKGMKVQLVKTDKGWRLM